MYVFACARQPPQHHHLTPVLGQPSSPFVPPSNTHTHLPPLCLCNPCQLALLANPSALISWATHPGRDRTGTGADRGGMLSVCACVCVHVRWGVVSTRKHKLEPVPSPRRSVSVCEPVACSSSFRPSLISVLLLLFPWILIHICT